MRIKFAPPSITKSDFKYVKTALQSGWLTSGIFNKKFEKLFSIKTKNKFCLSLNSCTSALEVAIKTLNLKKNSEILIPSFTWVSTANAVINCGHRVKFCDVNIETRSIDLFNLKKYLTSKTKAIIIVHYAGMVNEMDPIKAFCKKKGIYIIEDSAETLGGLYNNKHPGFWGIGCFSFFPTKNITTGEGGMITLRNYSQLKKAKALVAHGITSSTIHRDKKNSIAKKKEAVLPGHNYRLSNINAALGFSQLKRLEKLNKKRRNIANFYNKSLKELPLCLPTELNNSFHVYQMYTILVNKKIRNKLINFLLKNKIAAGIHFDPPVHNHKYYRKFESRKLPNTERLSKSIISLPIFPDMNLNEIRHVCKKIKQFFKKNK